MVKVHKRKRKQTQFVLMQFRMTLEERFRIRLLIAELGIDSMQQFFARLLANTLPKLPDGYQMDPLEIKKVERRHKYKPVLPEIAKPPTRPGECPKFTLWDKSPDKRKKR
tara:strand:+ start:236 stop:565 length:330 start_codon:yes stop_codon:yes gene_type:complete